MKFLRKLFDFFKKTKEVTEITQAKIKAFISKYKSEIRLFMSILEAIFPPKTGIQKMGKVVETVCMGMGLEEYSYDVREYVEAECQKIYDELKK